VQPAFFVIHPDGRHLYTCNSGSPGGISSYAIDPKTAHLTLVNRVPSGGDEPSYVCLDNTARFILVANYIGLFPGMMAPTSNLNTTAAWAIVVFVFYECVGVSRHGFKYFKRFLGPIPIMAPMMFIMEIISELARPFSLAIRLFANIMGGEMIIKLLFSFVAIGLPVVWMLWDSLITIPIQTFIFSLLTMVYLGGAIAADDEH